MNIEQFPLIREYKELSTVISQAKAVLNECKLISLNHRKKSLYLFPSIKLGN